MYTNRNRRFKCVAITLSVIIFSIVAISGFIDTDRLIFTNIYKGLFQKHISYNILPAEIYNYRNCCKIDTPIFRRHEKDEWSVNLNDCWYPVDKDVCDFVTKGQITRDTCVAYKLDSEFHINNFGHYFKFNETDIISGEPDYLDNITLHSGIYIHKELIPLCSFCNEENVYKEDVPLSVKSYLWAFSMRCRFENTFSKSSAALLDKYETTSYVCYTSPMIYIPFPFSGNGYIFSSEILNTFNYISDYIGGQNFYATYASIPSDIKRIGTIISYDKNGVLLKLPIKKTRRLRIDLLKLHYNERYYAAIVNYKKTHFQDCLREADYQDIMNLSNSSDNLFEPYDENVFINLSKLLSGNKFPE